MTPPPKTCYRSSSSSSSSSSGSCGSRGSRKSKATRKNKSKKSAKSANPIQRHFSAEQARAFIGHPIQRTVSMGATPLVYASAPLADGVLPPGWTGGVGEFGVVEYTNINGHSQVDFPLPPGWKFNANGQFESTITREIVPLGEYPAKW
jgi:hypothetical protein